MLYLEAYKCQLDLEIRSKFLNFFDCLDVKIYIS